MHTSLQAPKATEVCNNLFTQYHTTNHCTLSSIVNDFFLPVVTDSSRWTVYSASSGVNCDMKKRGELSYFLSTSRESVSFSYAVNLLVKSTSRHNTSENRNFKRRTDYRQKGHLGSNEATMTRSLRRSRRSTKKGISEYNEGDIVEVSVVVTSSCCPTSDMYSYW
jgi:hypothetical protein